MRREIPELTLGIGLVFAAAGAGLLQFELVGLFGIVLLALGAGMLLSAGLGARPAHEPPGRGSLAAYVAAMGLLLVVAVSVSYLAFASHRVAGLTARVPPSTADWILAGLASLAAAPFVAVVLRYRTAWAWRRCTLWGVAAFCVPVAAGGITFWMLHARLPVGA